MTGIKSVRKYFAVLKINLIMGLQYSVAAFTGVITQFAFGIFHIMIYKAFYDSAKVPPEMPFDKLVSYLWCVQAFLALITVWWQDNDLLQNIADGNIAYELNKPIKLYNYCFARICGKRIANVTMRFLPILIFAQMIPEPYNLKMPGNPTSSLLFIFSLFISLVLVVSISMFLYIITLKTLSPIAPRMIMSIVFDFFSGIVIPIPLMPDAFQRVLFYLPFRYISDWQFQIFAENINDIRAAEGLLIGAVWAVILLLSGQLLMNKMQKSIVIQGG